MRKIGILLLSLVLLNFACKNKSKEITLDDIYKFESYIAEVPNGVISVADDFVVVFQDPIDAISDLKELPSDWYSITPAVAGTFLVNNKQTIIFHPEKPLPQNTEFVVSLQMDRFYPNIEAPLKIFKFGVVTIKQQMAVSFQNLQSYNKENYYLYGEIRTADIANLDAVKKSVRAIHDGQPLNIKFLSNVAQSSNFQIKIDSILRKESDSEILISWNGNAIETNAKGEEKVLIPGKSNFVILETNVVKGSSPYIEIAFSDALQKNQNFNGLVQISNTNAGKLKFAVDGHVLKVYPSKVINGSATIEIFEGIRSTEGYRLKKTFSKSIAFEQIKPGIRFLNNGNILPSSSNLKINFEAVSLKAVDVTILRIYESNVLQFLQTQNLNGSNNLTRVARPIAQKTISLLTDLDHNLDNWTAFAIDLQKIITPEPGAIYRVQLNYKPSYSTYACNNTNFSEYAEDQVSFDSESEYSSWDGAEGYYDAEYNYNYDWNERDNPCHTSYFYNKKKGQNILASNIGVTVKKGTNSSYFIAVNNLLDTAPISNASVSLFNYQQQQIQTKKTNEKGHVFINSNTNAYFAIVSHNGQKTYVKLNDGNTLSVSKFDVAGVRLQKGLKGFIYGERGVWRPGDDIYLSFMLHDKANPLPANHPVKIELIDPYGKVVEQLVKKKSVDKVYNFHMGTDSEAPTGNYTAKVTVGGVQFTKTIKIETIKPNRLKIIASFADDLLEVNKASEGELEVKWLHGAIAKNLKADVSVKFFPKTTKFKSYPGFTFEDPARNFYPAKENIFKGTLNEKGKASFQLDPEFRASAPGMLQANILTKVYEEGGDFSTDVFSKTCSPYETYVGLLKPKGDKNRGMLLTDTKHRFEIQTVNALGKAVSVKNLEVSIYKINWKWWWNTSKDNLSSYSQSSYHETVFDTKISTNRKGQGSFEFELKYPEWGRYLVRVVDKNGGHATGDIIYVDWPGWAGKSRKNDPSAASMLMIQTDKNSYEVGETATVTFSGGKGGRALVTVENGSEVLDAIWVNLQNEQTKFELPITAEYAPNVFVHISALQPHGQNENDLPIRRYGITPLQVINSNTKLQPQLVMPEALKPEQNIKIQVKEQQGKAMTYTLAVVDEGLLDLTRFKTPNPWDTFFAKEALGVKTWDIYDQVIGAFGGRINQVFAIGGGEMEASGKKQKANRFKPVVIYKGPFRLKAGETNTHQVQLPMYVGSVRTMVIASNSKTEAYGSAEKATPVRNPLMMLTSLARQASPGEKAIIPVTVFAMDSKIKNVEVQLKQGTGYKIIGASKKSLRFTEAGEKIVPFEIEFTKATPKTKIEVTAKGHGESAKHELEIAIENPNPISSKLSEVIVDANSTQQIQLETFGTQGSNSANIEISGLPPMNFNGRLQNLIRYPHGCVEQTTSAAFPQLFLNELFELSAQKQNRIDEHIKAAIKRLARFQRSNGGLSYWGVSPNISDWGTSYAGHFMLMAENKGYLLPLQFKQKWLQYQKLHANKWRDSRNASHLAQAYRLYTLALARQANLGAMNRLKEISDLSDPAKYRLAATYAIVGQHEAAKRLLQSAGDKNEKNYYYTYGDTARNTAMRLETAILTNDKAKWKSLSQRVAKNLNSTVYLSTQSTAYSLIAMGQFAKKVSGKSIRAEIVWNGKKSVLKSNKSLLEQDLPIQLGNNSLQIKNLEGHTLFARINYYGKLPIGNEMAQSNNLNIQQRFKNKNGNTIRVEKLSQGTNFIAEVSVTNQSSNKVENVAISQLFPGGWEIVNTRFTDFGYFQANDVTHTDIRDDRVHAYLNLKPKQTRVFRVLLNASYLGTYYLPGAHAEAMYDNTYTARNKGKWIEVVK